MRASVRMLLIIFHSLSFLVPLTYEGFKYSGIDQGQIRSARKPPPLEDVLEP